MSESSQGSSNRPAPRADIDFSVNPRILVPVGLAMAITCWLAWYFIYRPFPVDSAIPHYTKVDNVSGTLTSVGSDTLTDVMLSLSKGARRIYPAVTIQLEDKGSGTAPPALTDGRSQLAPMSRRMTSPEEAAFTQRNGYKPTFYKIALDALVIYVNKENPIRQMTLQQVDGVFSSTRKRGGGTIDTWGAAGLSGEWSNRTITVYGRDRLSGTHDYFKEHALENGDFKTTVHEDLSQDIVEAVASNPAAIGYSGIGWKTPQVRTIALGATAGHFVEPTYENSLNGTYPLARYLYLYVNQKPGQPLDRLTGEFIKYALSHEGQEGVVEAKFFPLPATVIAETSHGER